MLLADVGHLQALVRSAKERVRKGYYLADGPRRPARRSLVEAIRAPGRTAVIAEVKFRSPSEGVISPQRDVLEISMEYQKGGAAAISVLTEPDSFAGSLESLSLVASKVSVPVLMKDIVVDRRQVDAGARVGADAVLLISGVFASGLADCSMDEAAEHAHREGLEVVAEVHDEEELGHAERSRADIIGINNRDLRTLAVSLETSKRLLPRCSRTKPVICESGIGSRRDVEGLQELGADGFLVGTALMRAPDPEAALRDLTRVRTW